MNFKSFFKVWMIAFLFPLGALLYGFFATCEPSMIMTLSLCKLGVWVGGLGIMVWFLVLGISYATFGRK